jgi:serine/threonine protein kinase
MSEAYRATSAKTGEEVVIKLLLPPQHISENLDGLRGTELAEALQRQIDARATRQSRFDLEIAIARLASHDHLLTASDHGMLATPGPQEKMPYLVYPYIEGGSLLNLLKTRLWQKWALSHLADLIGQIAEGLGALHAHGIVHMDVKPANLVWSEQVQGLPLARRGHIWVIDFGAAQWADKEPLGPLHATLAYAAPEVFSGEIKPTLDQYALALVARQLLTGEPPESRRQVALTRLNADRLTDPRVDDIFRQALARRPQDRFQDVRAFAEALRQVLLNKSESFYSAPTLPGTVPPVSNTGGATGGAAPTLPSLEKTVADHADFPPPQSLRELPPITLPTPPIPPLPLQRPLARLVTSVAPSLPAFPSRKLAEIRLPDRPTALSWSPDGHTLACTFTHEPPLLWHAQPQISETLAGFEYGHNACWSPDGWLLAVSIHDYRKPVAEIRFWERATRRAYAPLLFSHHQPIFGFDWSSRGHLALWLEDELHIYDFSTFQPQTRTALLYPPYPLLHLACDARTTVRWSPSGDWLALGANNGQVICWQPRSARTWKPDPFASSVQSLAWFPFPLALAALSVTTMRSWRPDTGSALEHLLPEGAQMISISPQTAAFAVATRHALYFGQSTQATLFATHPGRLCVAWSRDGKLATLDLHDDTRVVIWQTA